MIFRVLADFVMAFHFAFVLFAVFGGILALKRSRWVWVHVPAFLWAGLIEFTGWICPLTHLEIWLLERGGAAGYRGGFIAHYLFSLLYPEGLTRNIQVVLGVAVLVINMVGYGFFILRLRRKG